jgi:hypothetical protein
MANGVIQSMSMSAFVEGSLSLELPHIYMLFFQSPFFHFSNYLFIIFASPLSFKALAFNFFGPG